jgi:hypothetical protein
MVLRLGTQFAGSVLRLDWICIHLCFMSSNLPAAAGMGGNCIVGGAVPVGGS